MEEDLLRRFRESASRDALRALLVAHQDRIYNACFQVLRRAEDAEDAAQEALLKVAEGARTAADADALRGWVYRVSLRVALDMWRRREAIRHRETRAAMNRPAAPPLDDRERLALFEAMEGLDDRERALLLEHYFEKVPLTSLGERRGVSAVAIWKRIDRAREKLKKSLLGIGIPIASAQVGDTLEASIPAPAPPTLVGEALMSKVLAGGLTMTVTKSSSLASGIVMVLLLFLLTAGGYFALRSRAGRPERAPATATTPTPAPYARQEISPTALPIQVSRGPETKLPSPLQETLKRYRAWHEEGIRLATLPPDPENPRRNLDHQYRGFKDFREARHQIEDDPETFLQFIRDPRNEDLVQSMVFNFLGKLDQRGQGGATSDAQYYRDFPTELMSGLLELLELPSPPVKRGILSLLGGVHDVPAPFDERYEALMYDPDPMVQYRALWARWRQRPLDLPTLEKILARFQTTTDREVQHIAIQAISYSPRRDTFIWMLDSVENQNDDRLAFRMASAAASMSAKLALDESMTTRLIRNLVTVYERQGREVEQNSLLYSALSMSPANSIRVLEAALPKAATPKLKSAIESTIAKASTGSPTWVELQSHFWQLMK